MWFLYFFFFKQKTAYEMRISDWSSDVCSSDLILGAAPRADRRAVIRGAVGRAHGELVHVGLAEHHRAGFPQLRGDGRFVGWPEAVEAVRGGGGRHALRAIQVLDGDRPAVEPAARSEARRVGKAGVSPSRSRWA